MNESDEEYHMRVFGFYIKPDPPPPTEEEIKERAAKWKKETEEREKRIQKERELNARPKPKRADFRFKGRRFYFYYTETTSMWTGEYSFFRISYVKDFVTDEIFNAEDEYSDEEWEEYLEVLDKAEMRIFGPIDCEPYDCDNVW